MKAINFHKPYFSVETVTFLDKNEKFG